MEPMGILVVSFVYLESEGFCNQEGTAICAHRQKTIEVRS